MEYLDPRTRKAHLTRLAIGYVLVGIALLLTTIILLYQARGFGIKDGEVIQSGLIFVSSRPSAADIYINGAKHARQTNARLLMPGGQYTFELKREGYRPWKRAINVEGGAVVRFDYPVLFPGKLSSSTVKKYAAQPPLSSQSPDRRWLLVQDPSAYTSFDVFDLQAQVTELAADPLVLPDEVFELTTGLHRWHVAEWSNDNRHVLLQHSSEQDGTVRSEYILADREEPARSVNLSRTLESGAATISLRDKKYDQFYVYDAEARTIRTASLSAPKMVSYLNHVLAFKAHGDDVVLYATDQDAAKGKAQIRLQEGERTYDIREVASDGTYMLNLAKYEGAWYVAAGTSTENKTYVYKNPAAALRADARAPLVPVQVLKTPATTVTAFSDNARFIMAQGGQQIAVYDAETDRGYAYALPVASDPPLTNVTWMDGHRMMTVSGGKTYVFDFDSANDETLAAASAAFMPAFDRDYESLFTIAAQTSKSNDGTEKTEYSLLLTSLLTEADR